MLSPFSNQPLLLRVFAAAALLLTSCGDSPSVRFEELDKTKMLVALEPDESEALCDWATGLARARLPRPGTRIRCEGLEVPFNWSTNCAFYRYAGPSCRATVVDAEACLPAFFDAVAKDPCELLFIFAPEQLEDFLLDVPACAPMQGCAYRTDAR